MGQALAAGPSSPPRDLASSSSPQLGWQRSPAGSSTRTSPQPTWAAHTIPSPKKQVLKVGQGPREQSKGTPFLLPPARCTASPLHPRPSSPAHGALWATEGEAPLCRAFGSHSVPLPFPVSPAPLHFLTSVPSPLPSWWALPAGRGPSPGDEPSTQPSLTGVQL